MISSADARYPARHSHLGNSQGLDTAGVRNVGTKTQVNQGTTSVDSRRGSIRDLVLDIVLLILVVFEHLEQDFLGQLESLKGLLLLDSSLADVFNRLVVILGDRAAIGETHVVEETTFLKGRAVAETATFISSLTSFTENMGRRMPEDLSGFVVVVGRVKIE